MNLPKLLLAGLSFASCALAQNAAVDRTVMRPFEGMLSIVNGQVTSLRDGQPWALSTGDKLPVQQTLATGSDGYVQLRVADGGVFEIFSNSKILFRQNGANPNDVLDLVAGRVRLQLRPKLGQSQRVFSSSAIISARFPAALAMAVDEDETVRIDVVEGQVTVQHKLLPRNEAVIVKAIDAIVIERNAAISHRLDRGSLYRYTARILTAITFHNHDNGPIEGNKLLARSHARGPLRMSF